MSRVIPLIVFCFIIISGCTEKEKWPSHESRERQSQIVENFVGSAKSDKYHVPHCQWAQKIKEDNLVTFNTKDEATSAGYIPCKVCHPENYSSKAEVDQ